MNDDRIPAERRAALNERDIEMWRLWCAGNTQQAIARRYGISQPTVVRAIQRVRDAIPREDKDALIKREVAFLDQIRSELMADFNAPLPPAFNQAGSALINPETGEIVRDRGARYAAIDRVLRSTERFSKLLGLDQPVKAEVTGQVVQYILIGVDDEALQ